MNTVSTKQWITVGMLLGAMLWVSLMSLPIGVARTRPAPPLFRDNGSIQAEVTHLENQNFTITLSLRVTGKDGSIVGGLEQSEFEITEDNQPVAIKKFVSAGQQSVRACLVIDHSGSMAQMSKLNGAQDAAKAFVDLMRDGIDHLGLVVFNNSIREIVRIGPLEASTRSRARSQIDTLVAEEGTRLYDAMEIAQESMANVTGRKIMLVLTDGMDNQRDRHQLERIIKRSQELNLPLYMIGLGQPSDIDEPSLREFADKTLGQYLWTPHPEQLKEIYLKIGEALQSEYALTYDSPNPVLDGLIRHVSVSVQFRGSGTRTAATYSVGGVLAGGYQSKPASLTSTSEQSKREEEPPFVTIALPLLLLLSLLFGVPYLRMVSLSTSGQRLLASQQKSAVSDVTVVLPVSPVPRSGTQGSLDPAATLQSASPTHQSPNVVGVVTSPTERSTSAQGKPPDKDLCPGCGRKYPGVPGQRFCLVCDRTF